VKTVFTIKRQKNGNLQEHLKELTQCMG